MFQRKICWQGPNSIQKIPTRSGVFLEGGGSYTPALYRKKAK